MHIKNLINRFHTIDRRDIEILIAHVIQKPREFLIIHPKYNIGIVTYWRIFTLLKKRSHGTPLAYLTKHKAFFGLDFIINKHTLIPRPDTEIIVECVLDHLTTKSLDHKKTQKQKSKIILIDVGTGSGCIPISILKNIHTSKLSLIHKTFATDISKQALKIAQQNAQKHQVNITFLHSNLLESFLKTYKLVNFQTYHLIITANLPYLTDEQFQHEASIQHEPKSALVADNHGLALYEKLFQQLQTITTHCSVITLYCEIDPSQSDIIQTYIKTYFSHAMINIKQDLARRDRVVCVELKTQNPENTTHLTK